MSRAYVCCCQSGSCRTGPSRTCSLEVFKAREDRHHAEPNAVQAHSTQSIVVTIMYIQMHRTKRQEQLTQLVDASWASNLHSVCCALPSMFAAQRLSTNNLQVWSRGFTRHQNLSSVATAVNVPVQVHPASYATSLSSRPYSVVPQQSRSYSSSHIPGVQHTAAALDCQAMPDITDAAYFWMPEDKPYGALSHWYPASTRDNNGNSFPTVEHYMMYHKALVFDDQAVAQEVLSAGSPAEAKKAGRRVHSFDSKKWAAHRESIVFDGNYLKFAQHEVLRRLLLKTGDKPLVEASPEDKLWGIGYSAEDAPQHLEDWGQNLCGKIIERVRAKLQHASTAG